MNLSPANIQPQVPPGFRFHPTEEELLNYYLRKKVAYEKIDLDVIRDVDLNKLEPWEIQEICKIGSTHQNDWYFFSHKDKKYPTGTRTNRATSAGFWKATGRDKVIYTSFKRLGMRKTLVFYKGRAPHGQKSDWIMHEYRLEDPTDSNQQPIVSSSGGDSTQEEGWVVCRVFKKKSHPKSIDSPNHSTITGEFKFSSLNSGSNIALDQIIQYVGKQLSQETDDGDNNDIAMKFLTSIQSSREHEYHPGFLQRPPLVNQSILPMSDEIQLSDNLDHGNHNLNPVYQSEPILNWAVMDRVVGCHLNGQSETLKQLAYFTDTNFNVISDQSIGRIFTNSQESNNDNDLWCVDRSSSILSVTSQVSQVNQKNPN